MIGIGIFVVIFFYLLLPELVRIFSGLNFLAENEIDSGGGVEHTGDPGVARLAPNTAPLDADQLATADRLYDHDPQNYSAPRTVRLGAKLTF